MANLVKGTSVDIALTASEKVAGYFNSLLVTNKGVVAPAVSNV